MSEDQLIFLISLPRSGSTFLQGLLSNNDQVNTCSEPWILLNYANQLKPSLINGIFDNQLAKDAFENYQEKFPDFDFKELNRKLILDLYSPLLTDHSYVIDKTPRYWEMLEEMRELFPKGKMIILKRNPLHVAESIFRTWNIDSLKKMLNYERDLLIGPLAIAEFEKKFSENDHTYFLTYEDLVGNIESEVTKLYDWLGLSYNPGVLHIEKNNKFKGIYGDPFLNSTEGYVKAKRESILKPLNKTQKKWLSGYSKYLGIDFLTSYGNYKGPEDKSNCKKNITFSHFRHLCSYRGFDLKTARDMNFFFKEGIFRLLEKIL